ncbi:MAG: SPOR domain-containing protein [Pseudomonadota bacterium]
MAPGLLTSKGEAEDGTLRSTRLVARDVEAPDVFQTTDAGLWDGRPSLGGVWVAHPDAKSPERVIIRNETNGKFVIGSLFQRAREASGPILQISSDTAAALDIPDGRPTMLNVTALRKQEVERMTEEQAAAVPAPAPPPPTAALPAPQTAALAVAPSKPFGLDKPFIQIGLYSVEGNAIRTGDALRGSGIVPAIEKSVSRGKTFWRVLVGPATSARERAQLLKSIKGLGYTDAYFVSD